MDSTPCAKSELLLFHKPHQQVSTLQGGWVDFHPISTLKDGPIEFNVPGSSNDYIDPNDTYLYLKVQILHENKPVTKANAPNIAPVNLIASSLFQDIEVFMNNQQVEGLSSLYAYKAYILTQLEFGSQVKKTQCRLAGFFPDEPGKFDQVDNSGHYTRSKWVNAGDSFEIATPLWVDIFQQPRYILPGVDIRIKLIPNRSNFALMNFGNGSVKYVVKDAILYMRKVRVADSVRLGHETGLKQYNAIYPINRTKMSSFTIPEGSTTYTKDNLFATQSPKLVYIALVANSALNGHLKNSPFNFQHFTCNFIALYRNGHSVPIPPQTPNFENNLYARSYMQLIQSMETFNKNITNSITFEQYGNGSSIFCFNLAADLDATSTHQQPYNTGDIRLDLKFNKALPQSINVVICAIFDSKLEIKQNRSIIKDNL